jgi:quercetin dioxygenase-like cupin family protein
MSEPVTLDASYVSAADAPWVDAGPDVQLKVWRVDSPTGLWVLGNRFAPGFTTPTHRHTGAVDAFTISGRWRYDEYGIDYEAGSYVYEPANSVHTLRVPDDNTEWTVVIITISGALLYLAPDGSVANVTDGASTLAAYLHLCESQGYGTPGTIR